MGSNFKDRAIQAVTNTIPDNPSDIFGLESWISIDEHHEMHSSYKTVTMTIKWEEIIQKGSPCKGCDYFDAGCPDLDSVLNEGKEDE